MNKDEYIIVNKTAIQKRIEEWENKYGNEDIESSSEAFILMKEFLSQSTPLIPEIEKAYNNGAFRDGEKLKDYISNLKLDI